MPLFIIIEGSIVFQVFNQLFERQSFWPQKVVIDLEEADLEETFVDDLDLGFQESLIELILNLLQKLLTLLLLVHLVVSVNFVETVLSLICTFFQAFQLHAASAVLLDNTNKPNPCKESSDTVSKVSNNDRHDC